MSMYTSYYIFWNGKNSNTDVYAIQYGTSTANAPEKELPVEIGQVNCVHVNAVKVSESHQSLGWWNKHWSHSKCTLYEHTMSRYLSFIYEEKQDRWSINLVLQGTLYIVKYSFLVLFLYHTIVHVHLIQGRR